MLRKLNRKFMTMTYTETTSRTYHMCDVISVQLLLISKK